VPDVRLVLLHRDALEALARADAAGAAQAIGLPVPPAFVEDTWLWNYRLQQVVADPSCAPWLVRAVVVRCDDGEEVIPGYAGFHGPPDGRGMVEIGYTVLPEYRRRGLARAAVAELLAFAADHGATIIRASVSPGNAPSLGLIASYGFAQVGEQFDERDGRELVFERPAPTPGSEVDEPR
jgi:[ribosomal protein S5]-alanine N-acetyltransferase